MEKQLKKSEKRDAILRVLRGTTTHPSADWVYDRVKSEFPGIGLATVYRNLKILLDEKQIFKIDVGDGLDHYDAQTEIRHDHTYCLVCGAIGDANVLPEHNLGEFAVNDFSVESYSMVLFGKCGKCRQKEA